jgi:hypothetical protein
MKPNDTSRSPTRLGVSVFAPFAASRFNRFLLRRLLRVSVPPWLPLAFPQNRLQYAKISEDRTKTLRIPRLKSPQNKLEMSISGGGRIVDPLP